MAHGLPDFGATTSKAQLYAGVDMAELAARLGALPRYDRLGDVVAYEDFCSGMGVWEQEDSGAGETVVNSAARFVTGGFSCLMTTAAAGGSYVGILARLPVPYSVMYGIEIQWTFHANMATGFIRVDIYTGQYHLAFGIQYNSATNLNYYLNAAGGWTAIPGVVLPYFNDRNFIVSKFTFNISTLRYSRLLIPPRLIDLSGYTGFAFPDAVSRPRMELRGRIYNTGALVAYSYVDSLILTANDI